MYMDCLLNVSHVVYSVILIFSPFTITQWRDVLSHFLPCGWFIIHSFDALVNVLQWFTVADSEGGGGDVRPLPLKSAKKKKKCSNFAIFPYLVVKNANFSSLRSPALLNIIIDILLLKNLENNTCSYILPSFYTGEGNSDVKMQDFWALK